MGYKNPVAEIATILLSRKKEKKRADFQMVLSY